MGAGWRSGAWPKSRHGLHPGRRLDMLIWEACALRHSCRDLLAKGGFRLCQEPCIIVLYTYIIYFPRRVRVRGARVILREGSSTSGADKTRTKRSLRVKRELGDLAAAAHLQSTDGTVFRDMVTTRGRVPAMSARSGGQALKQERVPELRLEPTQWCGVEGADQAARKPGAPHRYHGRVASWQGCLCCVWPFARPGCDHHH